MIEQLNLLIVPPPPSSGRKLLRCRYVERRRFQSKVCRIGYFINQCRLERRPRIEGSYSHAKQSNHASHSSKGREQTGPTLVRIPKTAGHRIGRDSTRQPSNRGSEILMRLRRRERGGGGEVSGAHRSEDLDIIRSIREYLVRSRVAGFFDS